VINGASNCLPQQNKAAARGFKTVRNFIAIAYLRMARLKHLRAIPFAPVCSDFPYVDFPSSPQSPPTEGVGVATYARKTPY
jgi:hypothetical protein